MTVPIGLQAERFRLRGRDPGADVVARLKQNVHAQQAETELNLIAARLEQQYPETNKNRRVRVDAAARKVCRRCAPTAC